MSTIVVTGASGFVGSHVVPELIDGGQRVVALVRSDDAGQSVLRRLSAEQRPAVELRRGDVTRPETLPDALTGADAVVHLVAIPRDWSNGAELLLRNTEGRGISRGREDGRPPTICSPRASGGGRADPPLRARSKAKAERIAAERSRLTILAVAQWANGTAFNNHRRPSQDVTGDRPGAR
jgi:uncharacterized protein YbjT (DUF2867 family)